MAGRLKASASLHELPRLRIVTEVALFHLLDSSWLAVAVSEQLVLPAFLAVGAGAAVHHVPAAHVRDGHGLLLGAAYHDGDFRRVFVAGLAKVVHPGPA